MQESEKFAAFIPPSVEESAACVRPFFSLRSCLFMFCNLGSLWSIFGVVCETENDQIYFVSGEAITFSVPLLMKKCPVCCSADGTFQTDIDK